MSDAAVGATVDELLSTIELLVACLISHHHTGAALDCELCSAYIPAILATRDRATAGLSELGL